jgi:spermidine synthase
METLSASRRRAILTIFVVSGFTGLIYESIWSHYLKLFLGHAAYAQTLVLALYMGGLALGSWLIARRAARMTNLLLGYVLVEALIGLFGLVFHPVFIAASHFSFNTVIPALPPGLATQLYKWSLATLLVLPQSILLGMTFPLISGGLIRRDPRNPGETVASLYFTNSLGAAFGVLVSGFVLIGAVGLPGTIMTAAILNVALALVVRVLSRGQEEPPPVTSDAPKQEGGGSDPVARWFVFAAFATGAASFMYEVGWIRMLSLVLGSSTHSFELMLAAFIVGLAFGGLYVRKRIERIADAESYLGAVMLLMGTLAALTLPAYNSMFDLLAWCMSAVARTQTGYVVFNGVGQLIAILIMVPTTLCAGMTLPVLTHALMRRGKAEQAIGTIYAVNTLGAIVGVILTVGVIMPYFGVKTVILTGAGIHIALGLSRLFGARRPRGLPVALGLTASAAVFVVCALFAKLDPLRMVSGVYRTGVAKMQGQNPEVRYLQDGRTATISLTLLNGLVSIATNGKPDAAVNMGTGAPADDEFTMVLAAAMSLSSQSNPARVANIGFGSGMTSHVLLTSDQVKELDTIEIEPKMVEAARVGFGPRIHNVFEDPRSHIVLEDAKTFFASSREPFDVIVSEPSNPWVSGVASLFSDEFYGRITQYLRPGGTFAQWLQVYETDTDVFASVVKALSRHFPHYALYNLDNTNVLIVATTGGSNADLNDGAFKSAGTRAELDRIGVRGVSDLQKRLLGDERTLGALFRSLPVPANSDYFPFVDLNGARLRYLRTNATDLTHLMLLPLPFLELLGVHSPEGATVPPAATSGLVYDQAVIRALSIRDAIASGKLSDLDSPTAALLTLIDMSAQKCADPMGQVVWFTAVHRVTDQTIPYLRPPELDGVWSRITASACYQSATDQNKRWVGLLEALSKREPAEIERYGAQLLDSKEQLSTDDLAYITTAMGVAYVRTGDFENARKLLSQQLAKLEQPGGFALPLRELMVLSRPTAPAGQALAQAKP